MSQPTILRSLAHTLLDVPVVFQLQQRLFNNYENVGAAFAKYLQSGNRLDILDVGCSTAASAGQIIDMKRHHYHGVDIDPRYIELARKYHPDGHFLSQDARELPFGDAS